MTARERFPRIPRLLCSLTVQTAMRSERPTTPLFLAGWLGRLEGNPGGGLTTLDELFEGLQCGSMLELGGRAGGQLEAQVDVAGRWSD